MKIAPWVLAVAVPVCLAAAEGQGPPANQSIVSEARISADGQMVAYTRTRPPIEGRPQVTLSRISFAGGDAQDLVTSDAALRRPRWSPDGKHVGFIAGMQGMRGVLRVVPALGGAARSMSGDDADVSAFEWSLDGRRLIYLTGNGPRQIAVVDFDGPAPASRFPELADSSGALSAPATAGATTVFAEWIAGGQQSITSSNGRETWIDLSSPSTGARITVMPPGIATIVAAPSWSADATRFVVVGYTSEHPAEVFAGTLPLPRPARPDVVGNAPPAVRRITFSNGR